MPTVTLVILFVSFANPTQPHEERYILPSMAECEYALHQIDFSHRAPAEPGVDWDATTAYCEEAK